MKRRGVSLIISTVLLIFISLVIAGIIWNFSNSFLKKQRAETEGFSFYYDAKLYLLEELATAPSEPSEPSSDIMHLGVKRVDNEGNISGIRFIFAEGGSSYSYETYENPPNSPGIIEIYDINLTRIGISNASEIKKISMSLLYGNKKSTKILDEIELSNST